MTGSKEKTWFCSREIDLGVVEPVRNRVAVSKVFDRFCLCMTVKGLGVQSVWMQMWNGEWGIMRFEEKRATESWRAAGKDRPLIFVGFLRHLVDFFG